MLTTTLETSEEYVDKTKLGTSEEDVDKTTLETSAQVTIPSLNTLNAVADLTLQLESNVLPNDLSLQSYLSTTRLWKLIVVFNYCEAKETYSRI